MFNEFKIRKQEPANSEEDLINKLNKITLERRIHTLEMLQEAQSGHPGGSSSIAEIMVVLFYNIMNINPFNPEWEQRDRFVLSKGHAVPIEYSIKMDLGYFNDVSSEKLKLREINSLLQGHPSRAITIVNEKYVMDYSAGSLGMGFAQAIGIAHALKLKGNPAYIYVILGDGELQEGVIWEGVRFAADDPSKLNSFGKRYLLNNLIAFVDRNNLQNDDFILRYTTQNEKLEKIFEAFGWHVQTINGHNIESIIDSVDIAKTKEKPSVIIADTVKSRDYFYCNNEGKIEFNMENDPKYHGAQPQIEETQKIISFLNSRLENGLYPRDNFYDKDGNIRIK